MTVDECVVVTKVGRYPIVMRVNPAGVILVWVAHPKEVRWPVDGKEWMAWPRARWATPQRAFAKAVKFAAACELAAQKREATQQVAIQTAKAVAEVVNLQITGGLP